MNTSHLLYLLITGIASCIIATLLILIALRKCADLKKNMNRKRLQLNDASTGNEEKEALERIGIIEPNTPIDSFQSKEQNTEILKLAPPNISVEIPKKASANIDNESNEAYANMSVQSNQSTETNLETNECNFFEIDEGNAIRNILGVSLDCVEDNKTESESVRMTVPMRKYLMTESKEEEYLNNMIEHAVVIRHINVNYGKVKHCMPNRKGTKSTNNHDVYDYDYDDETLPILPDTNDTDGVTLTGESLTVHFHNKLNYKFSEDGYEWIRDALLNIDDEEWRKYLKNFKKNKVTESRLSDLKRSDMKELIPPIGPRNEFEKLLRIKLGAALSEVYDNSEFSAGSGIVTS